MQDTVIVLPLVNILLRLAFHICNEIECKFPTTLTIIRVMDIECVVYSWTFHINGYTVLHMSLRNVKSRCERLNECWRSIRDGIHISNRNSLVAWDHQIWLYFTSTPYIRQLCIILECYTVLWTVIIYGTEYIVLVNYTEVYLQIFAHWRHNMVLIHCKVSNNIIYDLVFQHCHRHQRMYISYSEKGRYKDASVCKSIETRIRKAVSLTLGILIRL